ncbi:UvrD-helicase domain-containing protein [Methanococcoides seepicolus]|uniref:UvrD-helicase domain-containing protein n=1 Tax=Methanococcoides seepicolus TaxID=2828780 RepID=A0A9E4ZEM1_9EURY|nr:UvrD-helicase domain-containing protein [Methanococcoides seepicolus]MCM1986287.1 UvrD-helicase domain-containing protein [Methanococcoides seepicolus]
MSENKLIIAAAGSGKTTEIIKEALKQRDGNILITTYTQANEEAIRRKIIEMEKCIPKNITVQTWFSFLIQDGIKPYQDCLFVHKINGMVLVNEASGYRFTNKNGQKICYPESNFNKYYFTDDFCIYSDKIAKLVFKLNEQSESAVINRLSKIYSHIFVDEVQDLAGYDLEFIKLLFSSPTNVILVGDPRQVTYLTHNEQTHKQYSYGRIKNFILDKCENEKCEIDEISLNISHRNNGLICDFSSRLYPNYNECNSDQLTETGHDGIFLVRMCELDQYLDTYRPLQLRYSITEKRVRKDYSVMNFGESKGSECDRAIIYPTIGMLKWVFNNNTNLADKTKAQFYVALTRAKYSVAIVCPDKVSKSVEGTQLYTTLKSLFSFF